MNKIPTLSTVAELLDSSSTSSERPFTLPLNQIFTNPHQPRRYFDPQKHAQLVESIRHHGILQPLLVRPVNNGYELVAGERRYRAALEAECTEAPVIIKSLSNRDAISLALTENLLREDLNPLEETEGILSLLSLHLDKSTDEVISFLYQLNNQKAGNVKENVFLSEEQQTIINVFQKLGKLSWESFVSSRLPLLRLPSDILDELRRGQLEYTKARAISKVCDPQIRTKILQQTVSEQLSLTQIKELIALEKNPQDVSSTPTQRVQDFSRKLRKASRTIEPKTWRKIQNYMDKIEQLLT